MHPAPSVLVFTTVSGAGYGLLFLLGLAGPAGLVPAERWFGFGGLALAVALIAIGLATSALHLRHPERAWRALSQWRSSWLSREGVMAVATFAPTGLFALGWVILETTGGLWALFGLLAAAGAVLTVYCTGQIYASLKTIRQWHEPLVIPLYLAFALATGAVWLNAWAGLYGAPLPWALGLALLAVAAAWGLKLVYWRRIGAGRSASTIGTATGLGALGPVRMFEPPHTEENYLLKEMGFQVARKHAEVLRRRAVILGGAVPLGLTALLFALDGVAGALVALAAAVSLQAGAFVERWLFFAEATHTVTLYYGAETA